MKAEAQLPPTENSIRLQGLVQFAKLVDRFTMLLGNIWLQRRIGLADRLATLASVLGGLRRVDPTAFLGNQPAGFAAIVVRSP